MLSCNMSMSWRDIYPCLLVTDCLSAELNVLFERLHELVDALHFLRDVNSLRTMVNALAATYAVAGLAEARHAAVIAYQEGAAGTAILTLSRRVTR